MTRKNVWLVARETKGMTLRQVDFALQSLHLPERYAISPSTISRLENGKATKVSPISLDALAQVYGKDLRDLDVLAAAELDELLSVLVGREGLEPSACGLKARRSGLTVSVPNRGLGLEVESRYEAA